MIHNRYLEKGGEDEVVNSEIKMLKQFCHQVFFYERSNREIKNFSLCGKLHFFAKGIIWSKKTYDEIKRLIKSEKPDIAHIHNIFLLISPSVYYALSEQGIPIIQALHNYRLFCPKGIFYRDGKICEECKSGNFIPSIIHRCWRNSFILSLFLARMLRFHFRKKTLQNKISAYIASSEFSKNKFIELGLPRDKISVKPHFVDLKIEKEEDRENYALFIGRLVDYKGINTLISAYEKLSNLRIKIIGDGPLHKELKEKVRKINNIELLGRLSSNRDVLECMRKSRFVIFPSECYETFGKVIIEAFACGVPVIVSRLGARIELVEDGRTGLRFTPGDPEDLASKIEWAWENSKEMEEMGRNARRNYEENYTPERNYEMLMGIYNKTIELHKQYSMEIS